MCVRKDAPTLACHYRLKSLVYVRVCAWCCTFCVFGQRYTCLQQPGAIQSVFTVDGLSLHSRRGNLLSTKTCSSSSRLNSAPIWTLIGPAWHTCLSLDPLPQPSAGLDGSLATCWEEGWVLVGAVFSIEGGWFSRDTP